MSTKHYTNFRWVILSLLFLATTLLYLDRSVLGILAPDLQKSVGWTESQYGIINSIFMITYALCTLFIGKVIDKIGTRKGYLTALSVWTVANIIHVFAKSWIGFAVARFGLAVGQSGNFPSAIKAVTEWFPKKDRALAVSVFNGGANVGMVLSPLIAPALVLSFGMWQIGFIWTLPIAAIWIVLWLMFYNKPELIQFVSDKEKEYISSDSADEINTEKVGWGTLLSLRATWAIAVAKFMSDPIWWFYIFWGAKFLNAKFGVDLKDIGLPFFTIYLCSWFLAVGLGWLSSKFMKISYGLNKGRKLSLLVCALFSVPVVLVPHVENVWIAVGLIAFAAGGHCGWAANVFSLMSDMFPKKIAASVAGFGCFSGAIGGALVALLVGGVLQNLGTDGYAIPFAIAGTGYFIALIIIHLLVPKIKSINI